MQVLIELPTPFSLAYHFLAYSLDFFSTDSLMHAFSVASPSLL